MTRPAKEDVMPAAGPQEFSPLTPRGLAGFAGLLIGGAVALALSLLYILGSLPAAPPGEGLSRWAAMTGVGVGVMLLTGVTAALLGQVANLGREVARLQEQLEAREPAEVGPDAGAAGGPPGLAAPGGAPEPAGGADPRGRLAGMFRATDSAGREHTVRVFAQTTQIQREGGAVDVTGPSRLVTDDGRVITRVEKGVYSVGDSDEVLTSDDPDAP